MNRLLLVAMIALIDPATAGKARAQGASEAIPAYAEEIVAQLQVMGYERFTVGRTLLGRIRVFAETEDDDWREIIVNPRTGEILRDYADGMGEIGDRLLPREQPGRFRPDDYDGWSERNSGPAPDEGAAWEPETNAAPAATDGSSDGWSPD